MSILAAIRDAFSLLLAGDDALLEIIGVSLKTSLAALAIAAPVAVAVGYLIAQHTFPGRRIAIWLAQAAMAMPTVLIGLLLYLTLSRQGPLGELQCIFAVLTSLFISSSTRGVDRRSLLLWLTVVMIISGLIVAFAPNYPLFMVGRALIGVVIGGFWSMSTATVMRLVPENDVPRALALLNGGNALATTIAAPLGSFLGQYIGWRGAFFCVVPLAAVVLAWQFRSLPKMPSRERSSAAAVFKVLGKPHVPLGMLAVGLFFAGQFALFTYLRPFLETVTGVSVTALSVLLLIVGLAGLAGTYVIGLLLRKALYGLLIGIPVAMAAIAIGLAFLGWSVVAVAVLLALWGLIATAAPVGWWTWMSKTLAEDAEAGGGLMVAVIQLSITVGASVGGLLFDSLGYRASFGASAALLGLSALVALLASRRATAPNSRSWLEAAVQPA